MKKISSYITCLLLITSLSAQEIKRLTLKEAIELSVKNSKQLQLDSLKIQALEFKKKQAQNAMIPVLGVSTSYARLSNNIPPFEITIPGMGSFAIQTNFPNQYNNRVSLQQPIFQGLRNWNTIKAIDQQKLAAGMDTEKDVQDNKLNIVQAYYYIND